MIKSTTEKTPDGVISAYSDNAAVIEGWDGARLLLVDAGKTVSLGTVDEPIHILMKVETHNHPTAISPFPGAATGSGGEIRDEGATGLGAKPKAGLTGFTVSHSAHPGLLDSRGKATFRIRNTWRSPLDIMIEGPIGGAAFNNEFGRPNLAGYFRTFESDLPGAAQERDSWLSQTDHDRRRGRQCAQRNTQTRSTYRLVRQDCCTRWSGNVDWPGWWRGVVIGKRYLECRVGLCLRTTRQPGD